MFTQGFRSRYVVLIAVLTGLGLLGVARPAHAQCQPRQLARLAASDAAASGEFGYSVAVSGDTAVMGAYGGAKAYVFVRSGGVWTEQATLTASDGAADDRFAWSVAISGDTAVIGAMFDDHAGGTNAGSAYVFVNSNGVWTQQAKLTASDAAANDWFGVSVSVSGDTAVIGASADDLGVRPNAGSAYVFVKPGGGWANMTQTAKLTASNSAADDYFGGSVSLSGDTAMIGGSNNDHPGKTDAGSAYVFVKPGGGWMNMTQTATLRASDAAVGDRFGVSVAVSVSGDTAVIGAYYDDRAGGTNSGSAYVFVGTGGGWTQQAKLTASDAAAYDVFGSSVAISGDTAVIGARYDDFVGRTDAGSAYMFVRSGGVWTQQAKLTACDAEAGDFFGNSVSVSGDTAMIGAPYDDHAGGNVAGSVYVFDLCTTPGDLDSDGDVDLDDYVRFSECLTGPGVPIQEGCCAADLNGCYEVTLMGMGCFSCAISCQGDCDPDVYCDCFRSRSLVVCSY